MKFELSSGALRLTGRQTLKVRDGAGSTICANEGSVWITEENQPRDVVLEAGGCYQLRNPGLAIVYPLGGEAAVTLN